MTVRPDLPSWVHDRPPRSRQYVIGTRRCRQRMAQALGQGMTPARVAAVNRLGVSEVEILLRDPSFQSLIGHYAAMSAEEPEARLARLRRMALDLLELALQAGDVRVAIFFAQEDRVGRDPSLTLARAAIRVAERLPPADGMADPRGDPAGDGTGAPPSRPKLPRRQPVETRRESEFPYCAATQGSEAEAAALEADEARRFAGRVGQTRRRLTTGLLAEAERAGTAAAEPPTQSAEAFARQAHGQGARAIRAAARWQERRAAFAEGRLADGADPTRPAAWIPGPSPGSSAGTARDHGGGGGTGRGQIPHWPGPREHASSSPASSNRHPGLEPGPRPKVGPAPERRPPPPADGPASVPGQTRDDERSGDAALASLQAPPPHLPDWLDQVPGVNRAQLLAMKPEERAVTLRTIARFYGFDTS